MSKEDRQDFDRYIDAVMTQNDVLDTAKMEGHAEGLAEGRAEGLAEGRVEGRAEGIAEGRVEERLANARNLKTLGISTEVIMKATGLSAEEIEEL